MKIEHFNAAMKDRHPGIKYSIGGGNASEIIPESFEWIGHGTAPTIAEIEAHYIANAQSLAPTESIDSDAQHAADMWSVKTILAHMPYRWDPNHGAPLVEVPIVPPATMPTDLSPAGGVFHFLGTSGNTQAFENPVFAGSLAFAAHGTSTGAFPSLVDHTDTIWRAPRLNPLSDQFFDIQTMGKHQIKLSHFAFRRMATNAKLPKTFDVLEQASVNEILVWVPIGQVTCPDAAQPAQLQWCSPIPVPATEFRNRYRLVPVSDWSGSIDSKDARLGFTEFEVWGTYRGPFG